MEEVVPGVGVRVVRVRGQPRHPVTGQRGVGAVDRVRVIPAQSEIVYNRISSNICECCGLQLLPVSTSTSKSSIRRFTEKTPTRAFSWFKAATTAFTFKTLLRHYAKRALTPCSLNVKSGPRRNYHKGRAAIRHYTNQPARPL